MLNITNVNWHSTLYFKSMTLPWPLWLSRLGVVPCTEGLLVQFPVRHMAGLWLMDAFFSLSLSKSIIKNIFKNSFMMSFDQ